MKKIFIFLFLSLTVGLSLFSSLAFASEKTFSSASLLFSSPGTATTETLPLNPTPELLSFDHGSRHDLGHGGNQYYYYDFGQVPVNYSRGIYFTLTSNGPGNLYLDRIDLWGQGFYGQANCPRVMPPGYRCNVYVEFRPWYEGHFDGRLTFCTSAGNFIIDLSGWGTRW